MRGHPIPAALVPAVLSVVVLSGCGAFTPAPPFPRAVSAGGIDANVGSVVLDDVYLEGPQGLAAGATAPLRLAMTNKSTAPDALIGVSSPDATGARLETAGRPVNSLPLPSGTLVDLEVRDDIQLTGLRRPMGAGEWFPVTLRFARAGAVTLTVTVGPMDATTPGPSR